MQCYTSAFAFYESLRHYFSAGIKSLSLISLHFIYMCSFPKYWRCNCSIVQVLWHSVCYPFLVRQHDKLELYIVEVNVAPTRLGIQLGWICYTTTILHCTDAIACLWCHFTSMSLSYIHGPSWNKRVHTYYQTIPVGKPTWWITQRVIIFGSMGFTSRIA